MSIISPELALAAAAAIGDKALQEQTTELLELRRQLAESRKVEITGSGGRPIYARGQFEDGEYRDESTIEGGIVYATTSKDEVEGNDVIILDNNNNNSRNVTIPIQSGGGCRNATLSLDLRDMPEPPWKMLKSAVSYNQTENNFDELIDVFDIMTSSRQLPQRLPNQVADIVRISFDTDSVRTMLLCLMERRKPT